MITIPHNPPPFERWPGAEMHRHNGDRFYPVFHMTFCFYCGGSPYAEGFTRHKAMCALRPTQRIGRQWVCDRCFLHYVLDKRTAKMPHYVDGTLAKVGDVVRGKPYNTPREVVGTVLQIVEAESCNCVIAFAKVMAPSAEAKPSDKAVTFNANDGRRFTIEGTFDYGETKAFALINRPSNDQ